MTKTLSIKGRLLALQAMCALALATLAWLAIGEVARMSSALTTVNDVNAVMQRHAINFRGSVHDRAIALRDVVLFEDPAAVRGELELIDRLRAFYDASAGPLDAMVRERTAQGSEPARLLRAIQTTEVETRALSDRIIDLRQNGGGDQALELLMTQARPLFTRSLGEINAFIDYMEAANQVLGAKVAASASAFTWRAMGVAAVIIVACLFAGLQISRGITRPLDAAIDAMHRLSRRDTDYFMPDAAPDTEIGRIGAALHALAEAEVSRRQLEADLESSSERERRAQKHREALDELSDVAAQAAQGRLEVRMTLRRDDAELNALAGRVNALMGLFETFSQQVAAVFGALADGRLDERVVIDGEGVFGQVRGDAVAATDKLNELVASLHASSDDIAAGVAKVATESEELSSRTESQAAAIEEAAAAMEEITSAVRATSEAAASTNAKSAEATRTAKGGVEVAAQAQDAIRELREGSARITEITAMVDQIAFQTNLLALNASVEAARAGEAGKGFAVVASEVRELAKRAANAAGQIKQLTDDNAQNIEASVERVEEASVALQRVREVLDDVQTSMDGISTANAEQTRAVSEVAETVSMIDRQTQENAQTAAIGVRSATALTAQTARMRDIMSFFRIAGQARPSGLSRAA